MWKALIKLVEKWAYRCEHDWHEINNVDIHNNGINRPHTGRNITYVCKKCCDTKQIKIKY